jgi:hypothetical protein
VNDPQRFRAQEELWVGLRLVVPGIGADARDPRIARLTAGGKGGAELVTNGPVNRHTFSTMAELRKVPELYWYLWGHGPVPLERLSCRHLPQSPPVHHRDD